MSMLLKIKSVDINPRVKIAQKLGHFIRLYAHRSSRSGLRRQFSTDNYDLTFFKSLTLRHDLRLSIFFCALKAMSPKLSLVHQNQLMRGDEVFIAGLTIKLTPLAIVGAENPQTATMSKGGKIYISIKKNLAPKGGIEPHHYTNRDGDGDVCELKVAAMVKEDVRKITKIVDLVKKSVTEFNRTKSRRPSRVAPKVVFADFRRDHGASSQLDREASGEEGKILDFCQSTAPATVNVADLFATSPSPKI